MGLLGQGWDDPQSAAVMNLAGGLLQGNFGAGLIGATNGYQDARMKALQAQDVSQQIQMRNLQLQQAQQQWQLQQPLLSKLVNGLGSGSSGMGGGMPAQAAQPAQPATQPTPGGALGSGTFGIPMGGQQASVPPQAQGVQGQSGTMLPGVPDNLTRWAIATGGIGAVPALLEKFNQPTDIQKLMASLNIDPSSPQGQSMLTQQAQKLNYIAPANVRPGGYTLDRNGNVRQFPKVPDGYTAVDDGRGGFAIVPVAGGSQAVQGEARAATLGKTEGTLGQGVDASGNPTYFVGVPPGAVGAGTPAPMRNNNPGALMPGGKMAQYPDVQSGLAALDQNLASYGKQGVKTVADVIAKWAPPSENDTQAYIADVTKRLGVSPTQQVDLSNPAVRQALGTAIMLHENGSGGVFGSQQPATAVVRPGNAPGYTLGQENAQNTLDKRWQALTAANSEAQNTKSYLDSIKQLAGKAAVGPFTDKLQFTNALLGLVGNEKASDATTANALLDKYSGQIVSRLGGSGGLATDAARSILQSAYPNAHMTKEAISEAADNISGAQSMVQAKAALLQKPATSRDPATYTQKEMAFDQNADPRIWQLKQMDPASAQKWLAGQPASVQADLRKRAANLKMLGVL